MDSRDEAGKKEGTNLVAFIAGAALGIVIVAVGIFLLQRMSTVSWRVYSSEEFGYEIAYPGDWKVTVAVPRDEWDMVWDNPAEDLLGDEIEKVTFQEEHFISWRGNFQVSVLENPEELGLEEWMDRHIRASTTGSILTWEIQDTALDFSPAKRVTESTVDYEDVKLVTLMNGRIYTLSYVGKSPNDREIERHRNIFDRMVSSFRFVE